jgi:hypothetical protein
MGDDIRNKTGVVRTVRQNNRQYDDLRAAFLRASA